MRNVAWTVFRTLLAGSGYGETNSAQQNLDGLHVWRDSTTPTQGSRTTLARRARNPTCPHHALLASLALHAPRTLPLAEFFSSLLMT